MPAWKFGWRRLFALLTSCFGAVFPSLGVWSAGIACWCWCRLLGCCAEKFVVRRSAGGGGKPFCRVVCVWWSAAKKSSIGGTLSLKVNPLSEREFLRLFFLRLGGFCSRLSWLWRCHWQRRLLLGGSRKGKETRKRNWDRIKRARDGTESNLK